MKTNIYFLLIIGLISWASPLLPGPGATAAAASITSFTLVNADNNQDLFVLTPGMVVDLASLSTRNLNIRADTDVPADSVIMVLSGMQSRLTTERVPPYALFSDFMGNYFAWVPPVGSYMLLATPYDAGGTPGAPLTLSFSFSNSVGSVTSFTLVNADTNLDLLTMTPGMTLTLASLPTTNLNIRANTNPGTVGSVVFDLTGAQTQFLTENVAPYALFSDSVGNYDPWLPTPISGTYSLTATPFDAPGGSGTQGSGLTISFIIIARPLPVQLTAFLAEPLRPGAVQLRWNTATEENNREFVVERSPDGRVFHALSRLPGHGSTTMPQAYSYLDQQLPAGLTRLYYRLQQVDVNGTSTYSPVRVVAVVPDAAAPQLQAYLATPNDGMVHYNFSGPVSGQEQLLLYSIMGQPLGQYPLAADGTGTVPVRGLSAGIYVLHIATASGRYAGRFALP